MVDEEDEGEASDDGARVPEAEQTKLPLVPQVPEVSVRGAGVRQILIK